MRGLSFITAWRNKHLPAQGEQLDPMSGVDLKGWSSPEGFTTEALYNAWERKLLDEGYHETANANYAKRNKK